MSTTAPIRVVASSCQIANQAVPASPMYVQGGGASGPLPEQVTFKGWLGNPLRGFIANMTGVSIAFTQDTILGVLCNVATIECAAGAYYDFTNWPNYVLHRYESAIVKLMAPVSSTKFPHGLVSLTLVGNSDPTNALDSIPVTPFAVGHVTFS